MSRRSHKALFGWLRAACVAAPILAGCDGGVSIDGVDAPASSGIVGALPAGQQLLDRMIAAESHVLFQGERHVEAHWKVGDLRYDLEYRELVSADGAGHFSVEPLDLSVPDLSSNQEDLFLLLSHSREGFYWRYRDFRIHHKPTFLRNYVVDDSGATVQMLGRDCAQLTVRRAHDAELEYHLVVDLLTGLVLRCQEITRDGAVIGASEYTSLDLAPNLSQVAWHQAAVDEQPLADPHLPVEVGTGAHQPRLVDRSFVLLSAKEITSTNTPVPTKFAEYVYTDGLECVFLLYGGSAPAPASGEPRPDDVVQLPPSVGPWQIAVATIGGERVTALGRVAHGDLLDLIASALY